MNSFKEHCSSWQQYNQDARGVRTSPSDDITRSSAMLDKVITSFVTTKKAIPTKEKFLLVKYLETGFELNAEEPKMRPE